jgi:Trk-type K+ transport system membrane component
MIIRSIVSIFSKTPIRTFVTLYAGVTLLGAILLWLPFSQTNGDPLSFIDALFVSVSGVSTTGLSTVTVATRLNRLGQVILLFLIQFGGIGLIMLIGFFWLTTGKTITLNERKLIATDQNQIRTSQVVRLIRETLQILFLIELIMFGVIAVYLYANNYFNLGDSLFQAFFLTISLTANAGFDITGDSLLRYANDYTFQVMAMFLMFVGAVGFWPLVEFKDFVQAKFQRKPFQFSLFAKLLVSMHMLLWVFGAVVIFAIEAGAALSDLTLFESIVTSFFMSLTTRNAGFSTIDVSTFSPSTLMMMTGLMFIGSSPNSAGGGIRTSTLLLIIGALIAFSQNRRQVIVQKRAIKPATVYKSLLVFVVAIALIIVSSFLIMIAEPYGFTEVIFEVTSAFGTTGLSLGITPFLSGFSKAVLIVVMFIGRIGIVALLLIFSTQEDTNRIRYPEIDMIVG